MIREAFSLRAYENFEPMENQSLVPRWCDNHFGIDQGVFRDYRFWQRAGGRGIWITPTTFELPADLDLAALGMLVMRKSPPKGKPTSVFLQRFGETAFRNVYVLSEEQALSFLKREPLAVQAVDDARGYALVRTANRVIGCGRIAGGQLHSEIPKHWLAEL